MAEIINEVPTELWAGMNNEQYYGDDLGQPPYQYNYGYPKGMKYNSNVNYPAPPVPRNRGGIIRNAQVSQGALEKLLAQAGGNQTVTPTATGGTSAGFNASEFFAQNKWLVLGGGAVVAYFLFFGGGGGGLAESTVIKRFNKR